MSEPNHQTIILAVDDYPAFLDMIETTLQAEGYQVWTATNGQDALDRLLAEYRDRDRVPDVILADIMMPVMDGFTFYEHVRGNPYLNHIPFIFLTAKAQIEDIRQGKELGADDYLCKPCTVDDLLSSVRGKLQRMQQQRTLAAQFTGERNRSRRGSNLVFLIVGVALVVSACLMGAFVAAGLL
ncbi:MAG: response regulator [Anaerolineae bacterium]|nr:response regulator [Anaerolineae bacterium]